MLTKLEKNKKYFATVNIPDCFNGNSTLHSLRFIVLNIKKNTYTDYITIQVLQTTKDTISVCGYNPITIPIYWITQIQSLNNILDKILIDDIIYLIDQYI